MTGHVQVQYGLMDLKYECATFSSVQKKYSIHRLSCRGYNRTSCRRYTPELLDITSEETINHDKKTFTHLPFS